MSFYVAVRAAERTTPSWEHLQAEKPNHKSSEKSKSPSINSLGSQMNDSLVRVFWPQQRWKKMLLSEQVGAHADHTLLYHIQEARQSLFTLMSTQPSWSQSKGIIKYVFLPEGF